MDFLFFPSEIEEALHHSTIFHLLRSTTCTDEGDSLSPARGPALRTGTTSPRGAAAEPASTRPANCTETTPHMLIQVGIHIRLCYAYLASIAHVFSL
jgi:hypothetical protein